MELDLAARALCQSLDLASGGRERVLDRDLDVHVAPVIGRLVADHDVLVGRNRYPDVDTDRRHRGGASYSARRRQHDTR